MNVIQRQSVLRAIVTCCPQVKIYIITAFQRHMPPFNRSQRALRFCIRNNRFEYPHPHSLEACFVWYNCPFIKINIDILFN